MKTRFLSLLLLLGLASCTKNPPPIIDNPDQPDEIKSYGGTYYGSVYKHSAGVDADGVYKTDTTYDYSVTIFDESTGYIGIKGSDAPPIAVDSTGFFSFNEFNHNIKGNFVGDSLYLFTEAISGTYDPPQFYDNTQMSFSGKKN